MNNSSLRANNIEIAFSTNGTKDDLSRALENLKLDLKNKSREEIRLILLPYFAKIFGIHVINSKNTGKLSLDKSHKNYEAARKGLYRLTEKIIK